MGQKTHFFNLESLPKLINFLFYTEITAHGHGEHKSSCPDCKGQDNEYSFVGDHNNVNKYHEDDKNPEHHGHRDSAENHGHSHHNHDFIENHGHGHRNRHH